eukprot:gene5200-6476_t
MNSKELQWAQSILNEKQITFKNINDFRDGVLIIELLQCITDKQIKGYFKSPKNRIQYIENANIALTFMKQNGLLTTNIVNPQENSPPSTRSLPSSISLEEVHQEIDLINTSISDNTSDTSSNHSNSNHSNSSSDINKNQPTTSEMAFKWKKILNGRSSLSGSGSFHIGTRRSSIILEKPNLAMSSSLEFDLPKSSPSTSSTQEPTFEQQNEQQQQEQEQQQTQQEQQEQQEQQQEDENNVQDINNLQAKPQLQKEKSWFTAKVDNNIKEIPKRKVPHLVKISPVDLERYNNPEFVPGIIKCQCIIRGWLARKELKSRIKKNRHRNKCFKEIVATEESYVQGIAMIVNVFYQQILWNSKVSPTPYLTAENITTIFSTINEIYSVNSELLARLRKKVDTWNHYEFLGEVFLDLGHFLKLYKIYCLNYDSAIECLKNARKNEKFEMFIKACLDHPENNMKQSLESLLITVVQRIPRYILLLQDMVTHTWSDHLDYDNLKNALKMIQAIAIEVNSSIKMAESQAKVYEIQKSLVGWDRQDELVRPSRLFIKQGILLNCKLDSRFSKDFEEMVYFLFNDSILITEKENSHRQQFKYFFDTTDSSTRVKDVEDSLVMKNGFQIISGQTTAIFSCPTPEAKRDLIKYIDKNKTKSTNRPLTMNLSSGDYNLNISNGNFASLKIDLSLSGPYTIEIKKTESKKEPGKKQFTIYYIDIVNESTGEVYTITKRYSDFDTLHKKLERKFPEVNLKELPKKHLINSLGTNTVESRRIMLEVFLQNLFQIDVIKSSPYLMNFIKPNQTPPQVAAVAAPNEISEKSS